MAKSRPSGGRPPGRRGRGGVGPGPGYRAPGTGKGTTHGKSSSTAYGPVLGLAVALVVAPLMVLGALAGFLLHGYGIL